ncbi:hypothetical protein NPA31_011325 [Aurantimonas sp. MSK8Z-1]|uniref:four-carbon acid sugar kinase family protein n=1 Tax=Mangrovibrevibacter kandeliae TaxID=2968473 RepID=UPI002117EA10|nr:four-carbon acid sugar kinase family protein [Aurantimonas sp. MSK8Z-1]MCW4115553.1 hypothetical protein [Aurantimonas sp. MSK8Z-1]
MAAPTAEASGPAVVVLADDLTGANDSGLHFAAHGLRTRVFVDPGSSIGSADCDVVILDCESRGMEADGARAAVRAAHAAFAPGASHLYKKIDSTLRGNVGAEIDEFARAAGATLVLMTPAYPAMGRTVEDGVLLVNGTPVAETAIAADPANPVRESRIQALLEADMPGVTIRRITPHDLPDAGALAADAERLQGAGGYLCLVADAASERDIEAIAAYGETLSRQTGPILWAGSAGLAAPLPKLWALAPGEAAPALAPAARPALLVCGSVNPVAVAQLDRAAEVHGVEPVVLAADALFRTRSDADAEIERCVAHLSETLGTAGSVGILTTAHAPGEVRGAMDLARRNGLSRRDASRIIARGLGQVAQVLIERGAIGRLLATGGDTARAVLEAAGIEALDVRGTVLPGMPLVTARGTVDCHIVTKAGGFGDPDALADAMRHLIEGRIAP